MSLVDHVSALARCSHPVRRGFVTREGGVGQRCVDCGAVRDQFGSRWVYPALVRAVIESASTEVVPAPPSGGGGDG